MRMWIVCVMVLLIMLLAVLPCMVQAKIVSVSASRQVLALNDDGTVWAWGDNIYGQLGIGVMGGTRATPQKVLIDNVTAIAAGGSDSFALKSDGTVWAWGYGADGRLGYGGYESQSMPVQVKNLTGVVAIAAGAKDCYALKSDGTVWAWGDNNEGQIGDGTTSGDGIIVRYFRVTPVQVRGLAGVKALGEHGNFAIKDDGTVYAWGQNTYGYDDALYGALGDSSGPGIRPTPFQVKGVSDVKQITSLMNDVLDATIYVKNDGTVWAWGTNYCGALGDGTIKNWPPDVRQPSVQLNLADVMKVSSANSHSIALENDGTVWVWGMYIDRRGLYDNSGLPPTNKMGEPAPVGVNGLDHVVDVSAGDMCDIVLKDDGTVWGWGRNDEKELGDRKNIVEPYPVLVFEGPAEATPTPTVTPVIGSTSGLTDNVSVAAPSASGQAGVPVSTPGFGFDTVVVLGCLFVVIGLLSGLMNKKGEL